MAATLAFATPPASETPDTTATKDIIQKVLLTPLSVREVKQSRFSRSRQPAQARRVRVIDEHPQKDSEGKGFMTFAIDARHGWAIDDVDLEWRKDVITGCTYAQTGEVFIKRGAGYYAADIMLGKKTRAAAEHVCVSDVSGAVASNK